jgi:carbon starvation protein
VANQLLAAIALGVGTTVIIKSGRLKYEWVTFVPLCFMFVTTLTAAWQLTVLFRAKAAAAKAASDVFTFNLDALLMGSMGVLAVIALADMVYKWYGWVAGKRQIKTTETPAYPSNDTDRHNEFSQGAAFLQ